MPAPEGAQDREVLAFLAEFALDRERGMDLPLAHYLSRFPGLEEEVAREFLQLRHEDAPDRDDRTGPYERLAELGRGGQGVVWLARDTRVDRRVALKVLHDGLRQAISPERLRREARLAARIEHPGVETVYDTGEVDGQLWLATQYVPGESLATLLERSRRAAAVGGPRRLRLPGAPADEDLLASTHRVLRLVESVADALAAAHRCGVVHRDVKPGNLLAPKGGHAVLIDFGLARAIDPEVAANVTSPGELLGTPAYLAPERMRGDAALCGPSADLWALGAVLYECLTLERPFSANSPAGLQHAVEHAPTPRLPRPRGADRSPAARMLLRDLDTVLQVALAKAPRQRYATAGAFADDLRRIRLGLPPNARPPGRVERAARFALRHPRLVLTVTAVVTVLTLALLRAEFERHRADRATAMALERAGDLRRLAQRLVTDLHAAVQELPGGAAVNRELLSAALEYLALLHAETDDEPLAAALRDDLVQVHLLVGDVLGNPRRRNLGDLPGARQQYDAAVALLGDGVGRGDAEFARLRASALLRQGELDEHERATDRAMQRWQRGLEVLAAAPVTAPATTLQATLHLRRSEAWLPVRPAAARAAAADALALVRLSRGAAANLDEVDLQEAEAQLLLARATLQGGDERAARRGCTAALALLDGMPDERRHGRRALRARLDARSLTGVLAATAEGRAETVAALDAARDQSWRDEHDLMWARLVVACRGDQALLELRRGDLARATTLRANLRRMVSGEDRFHPEWATDLLLRNDAALAATAAARGRRALAACLYAAALAQHRGRCDSAASMPPADALRLPLLFALLP